MNEFLKHNFLTLILLVLGLLYFLGVFDGVRPAQPDVTTKTDTVWNTYTQTVPQYQPIIIQSTPPTVVPPQYKPDTSYRELVRQYQSLVEQYLTKNVYRDTIKLDSFGYVALEDTVSENQLKARKPTLSYRIPTITNTVTIREPYKPKNQLYAGVGMVVTPQLVIQGVEAGLLLKNKKDQIIGIKGQYNFQTGVVLGGEVYGKIKLW